MTRLHPVPDLPIRAIGAIRVSQERDGMISPELQRSAIEDYCTRRGYQLVGWIEGIDESGSAGKSRWWPRLDEALAQVEAGDADAVVVWKFSRTARHRLKWAVALDRVASAGGILESATEQVDTTTSTGRLTRGMLGEIAAWESERIGDGWREAHARRTRAGLPHYGVPRLGYAYNKVDGYTIDPSTAPHVVEAYRLYLAGAGLQLVADYLNERGLHSPRTGRRWTKWGIGYALDSGYAAGWLHTTTGRTPGAWKPLVDAAIFDAYLRERTRRTHLAPRNINPQHWLTGLVRCAGCTRVMRLKWAAGKPLHVWRCQNRECRSKSSITTVQVETFVLAWLRDLEADLDARQTTAAAVSAKRTVMRADRTRLRHALDKVDSALSRMATDALMRSLPASVVEQSRVELIGERDRLLEAITAVAPELEPPKVPRMVIRGLIRDWDHLDVLTRRETLRRLLRAVIVARATDEPRIRPVPAWE